MCLISEISKINSLQTTHKMKNLWLVLPMLLGASLTYAQDSTTTGHILYKDITDISDNPWTRNRPDMPTEVVNRWDLYFNPQNSFCTFHPEEEDDDFATGGVSFRMMRWEPKDVFYMNFVERRFRHYNEFMGEEFNISDTLSMQGWRMTGKQGIVLGYPCMEAKKIENDTVEVLAWFTPRIPVSTGPVGYTGFPGAVLYVNIDDGQRTITAERINMGRVSPEEQEYPDDGEEMNRKEYETLVEEKTAQMRRRWGR